MATTPNDASVHTRAGEARHGSDDSVVSHAETGAPDGLQLLDDDYAQEILAVLSRGPQRGRDLAAACDASRPTVYRRVNSLQDAGLVTAEMTVDPDGHHCKEFRLARDTLQVTIADGTITVTTSATDQPS